MSNYFVGEIRMFAGNFEPNGWYFCDGRLLSIYEYETLYNLIGTTYGGDGESTFALPDLRGRVPIHMGNGFTLAETGGVETVTLTVSQIPAHSHPLIATSAGGDQREPQGGLPATDGAGVTKLYAGQQPTSVMSPGSVSNIGGSQPHNNFQPYLCVDFIISLYGTFPSES